MSNFVLTIGQMTRNKIEKAGCTINEKCILITNKIFQTMNEIKTHCQNKHKKYIAQTFFNNLKCAGNDIKTSFFYFGQVICNKITKLTNEPMTSAI